MVGGLIDPQMLLKTNHLDRKKILQNEVYMPSALYRHFKLEKQIERIIGILFFKNKMAKYLQIFFTLRLYLILIF